MQNKLEEHLWLSTKEHFWQNSCEQFLQIDYQEQQKNRWQQKNGLIIHDFTSVKYNKENEIFSHQLTWFPRLKMKEV